jgi:hypothetical protein
MFEWLASFSVHPGGLKQRIVVDGRPVEATTERQTNQQTIASVRVPVNHGQTRTAKLESN